jgi:hypothetical protein
MLVRWSMVGTYSGILEGSKGSASRFILDELADRAERVLPPGRPLAVVGPPTGELPEWLCIAQFESYRAVRSADVDFCSRLYVCWFMDNTARPLDEIVEAVLPHVDWERLAEDYDLVD